MHNINEFYKCTSIKYNSATCTKGGGPYSSRLERFPWGSYVGLDFDRKNTVILHNMATPKLRGDEIYNFVKTLILAHH